MFNALMGSNPTPGNSIYGFQFDVFVQSKHFKLQHMRGMQIWGSVTVLTFCPNQFGRVVKVLELISNKQMSLWIQTPLLVTNVYSNLS